MLTTGLIINYGIILFFQTLDISLIIGSIVSISGLFCWVVSIFKNTPRQFLTQALFFRWIGISFVCLLFLSPILTKPLTAWDARSIWFFHAKMIYYANSIGQFAGWQHPSVSFSHIDYPKLVPAIAAQVANLVGFWNEYIPKASLFFMLVPATIWLFTFARHTFSFGILLLLLPFSFSQWIWNGYLDGYFALYFSLAMLLFGRYIKFSRPIDLISGFSCLFVLLYIKNEGVLALFSGLCAIILINILFRKKIHFSRKLILQRGKYYLAGLVAILPFVLWSIYKQNWNLSNDLEIGIQSWSRIVSRLNDGSYKLVFVMVFKQIEASLIMLGLIYFTSAANKKAFVGESLPALVAAGIFCLGIIIIYLLTPHDLVWHLETSVDRLMLSVNSCIYIASFFILRSLENDQTAYQNLE